MAKMSDPGYRWDEEENRYSVDRALFEAMARVYNKFADDDPVDLTPRMAMENTIGEETEAFESWARRQIDNQKVARKADALGNRLNRFVSTFDEMGERVRRLESQTQFETSEDDARIKALEHKANWIQEAGASAQTEFARRIGAIEMALHDYGIPKTEWVATEAKTPTSDDAYDEGRMDAVNAAAERLREYLTGFLTRPTVDAAVRVVRGEQVTPATNGFIENPLI
jgi:hypothetical protein